MDNSIRVLLMFVSVFAVGLCQSVNRMAVRSDIRFRFATTEVTCVMSNDNREAQDLLFNIILPKDAFIFNFSMTIEGKDYPGHVKEKKKAKQTYDAAVQAGHSAGLVTQSARHSNQFEVSVNIAAGGSVTFHLQYQELLRRRLGVYEYSVYIDPSTPSLDYSIEVYIQDRNEIKDVRTPAIRKDIINNEVEETRNSLTEIRNPSSTSAYVIYRPIAQELRELKAGWFVVQYDVESPNDAGDLLVVDGYFVHFFMPPDDLPPLPLDIVFVLDVSGSMSGQKIDQLKDAMHEILDDLRQTDRFNILLFDGDLKRWKERLRDASLSVVDRAHSYVTSIRTGGLTDLYRALMRGLELLQESREASRVPVMFFLTDGEATTGVQDSERIVHEVSKRNEDVVNIYSLAFGSGADYNLLKQISAKNKGFARKIYEGSDASSQVSGLYREISTVVMRNLTISYYSTSTTDDGEEDTMIKIDEPEMTINNLPVVFHKSDFAVAGNLQIREKGDSVLMAPGKAGGLTVRVSGLGLKNKVNFLLQESDLTRLTLHSDKPPFWAVPRNLSKMTERTWAFLTIKQLLEQKVAAQEDAALVRDLDSRILELSLKYHFVTPLTSMVVTRPEDDLSKSKGVAASFVADDDVRPGTNPGRTQTSKRPFVGSQTQHSQGRWRHFIRQGSRQHSPGNRRYHAPVSPKQHITGRRRHLSLGSRGHHSHGSMAQFYQDFMGNRRGPGGPLVAHYFSPLEPHLMRAFGVRLLHVTANDDKGCFELKALRAPHNYTVFADPVGNFSLTTELSKKLMSSVLIRDNDSTVAVRVDTNGNLIYSLASPNTRINISNDNRTLSVGGGQHRVTVRVANQKCRATWLSIDISAGGSGADLTSGQGYRGIVAVAYQNMASTSKSRRNKGKEKKKGRKPRKTKTARSCISKSIPSDRSFILKGRKLLPYKS